MSKYYKKNQGSDPIANLFGALGSAIVSLLRWIWSLITGKKSKKFDRAQILRDWMEIEKLLQSGDEIHAQQAVIRADKYFDDIMKRSGARGEKFADRLRSIQSRMSYESYQGVWDAHKLRNQISHEVEHRSSVTDCKMALSKFRQGLQALNAL